MWVDWREEDDAIIEYCEEILHTGNLSGKFIDSDNERGFDVVISYNGNESVIPYPHADRSDRDTTLITLARTIYPEYQLRFWKDSDGSDTLGFIPLKSLEWKKLEETFGKEKVGSHFEIINENRRLFGE